MFEYFAEEFWGSQGDPMELFWQIMVERRSAALSTPRSERFRTQPWDDEFGKDRSVQRVGSQTTWGQPARLWQQATNRIASSARELLRLPGLLTFQACSHMNSRENEVQEAAQGII